MPPDERGGDAANTLCLLLPDTFLAFLTNRMLPSQPTARSSADLPLRPPLKIRSSTPGWIRSRLFPFSLLPSPFSPPPSDLRTRALRVLQVARTNGILGKPTFCTEELARVNHDQLFLRLQTASSMTFRFRYHLRTGFREDRSSKRQIKR